MKQQHSGVLLLGGICLLGGLGVLGYGFLQEKALEETLREKTQVAQKLKQVEERLQSVEARSEEVASTKSTLDKQFKEEFHLGYDEVKCADFSGELQKIKKERSDIRREMHNILTSFEGYFPSNLYEQDLTEDAFAQYAEILSKESGQMDGNLRERLHIPEIFEQGHDQGMYRLFHWGVLGDRSVQEEVFFHLLSLGQPLHGMLQDAPTSASPKKMASCFTILAKRILSLPEGVLAETDRHNLEEAMGKMQSYYSHDGEYKSLEHLLQGDQRAEVRHE